jgi:hypothetical protein
MIQNDNILTSLYTRPRGNNYTIINYFCISEIIIIWFGMKSTNELVRFSETKSLFEIIGEFIYWFTLVIESL